MSGVSSREREWCRPLTSCREVVPDVSGILTAKGGWGVVAPFTYFLQGVEGPDINGILTGGEG